MFRAVKNPLEVEVTFDGRQVRVKPVKVKSGDGVVGRTLARCEEFMAQVFLSEQKVPVSYARLVDFFKGRGWAIAG
jgi:hypothetical protein